MARWSPAQHTANPHVIPVPQGVTTPYAGCQQHRVRIVTSIPALMVSMTMCRWSGRQCARTSSPTHTTREYYSAQSCSVPLSMGRCHARKPALWPLLFEPMQLHRCCPAIRMHAGALLLHMKHRRVAAAVGLQVAQGSDQQCDARCCRWCGTASCLAFWRTAVRRVAACC
jgi:hypothetical protein